MSIEIIAIASEVLTGATINTNAAFISRELTKEGFTVARQLVLPDNYEILKQELSESLKKNALVIVTGGLGPTLDDITRKVVADVLECSFSYNEEVANDLKRRYGDSLSSLKDQATLPSLATPLINGVGTAPGLIFATSKAILVLMPGVPLEMEVMMSDQLMPYLKTHLKDIPRKFYQRLHFFQLTENSVDLTLRILKERYPHVEVGIYPTQGALSVSLMCEAKGEREAFKELEEPLLFLKQQFAAYVFESTSGKLEEAIHHLFIDNKLTLSLAESCTGGGMAAALTKLSGCSRYFLGSLVCYANSLKTQLLHVPEDTLREYGAVSEEVVRQMAIGALEVTGSDFSIAVTGIAGPDGGTPTKPVGTVYGAIGAKGREPRIVKLLIPRTRSVIIERTINILLSELLKEVRDNYL